MKSVTRFLKRNLLWVIFAIFAVIGIVTRTDNSIFISEGAYSSGKYIIWLIFFGFLGYSIYCSQKENFFKSVKRISGMLWGWQIGIDLYIGLLLPLLIIYMHGGIMVFLIWIIPVLLNANLFTLLYFALNYDSLVAQFIA